MKNLEALEALEKSANEQEQRLNNTIAEIHEKRLQSYEQNLTVLYRTSLKNLESNIQEQSMQTIKNISYELERLRVRKNWKWLALGVLGTLAILGAVTYFTITVQYQKKTNQTYYFWKMEGK